MRSIGAMTLVSDGAAIMSNKLKHPFPGEPFGINAFLVRFGGDAVRKHHDATWARGYVGDEVADELKAEMYELCARHTGATVAEVKAFLANLRGAAA